MAKNIGKTKNTTDNLIDGAIQKQGSWKDNRRIYTRSFLKVFNSIHKPSETNKSKNVKDKKYTKISSVVKNYWFPILCGFLIIVIAIVVMCVKINTPVKVIAPVIPEPVEKVVKINNENKVGPVFDLVRIEKDGNLVVAGHWDPEKIVSVIINHKLVSTVKTNKSGDFVYAPTHTLKPGNYVIALKANSVKSEDSVFVYVSDLGYKNSISLLMTKNGSTILQSPELSKNDLVVSKIDYLDSGRIVVTGKALPRLRVSLSLNDEYIGFARVSDYKNFGLGADVGELVQGQEYKLNVRLHDGDGTTIANIEHKFIMPKMTGDEDTFYTVRKGDCLWIIAKNFLRKGVLFTIIAEKNNIVNPDLIFPKQTLQIPVNQ